MMNFEKNKVTELRVYVKHSTHTFTVKLPWSSDEAGVFNVKDARLVIKKMLEYGVWDESSMTFYPTNSIASVQVSGWEVVEGK